MIDSMVRSMHANKIVIHKSILNLYKSNRIPLQILYKMDHNQKPYTDIYCDFHEWIAMINKLRKESFRRNTVGTVRIVVTIMEISWSQ
jgi:hypothetical protein